MATMQKPGSRLRLLGSDVPVPTDAAPLLHGLYTSLAPGGCRRAVIARNGRVLLDATYDPSDLSEDDLDGIYHIVTARRR